MNFIETYAHFPFHTLALSIIHSNARSKKKALHLAILSPIGNYSNGSGNHLPYLIHTI
jgi:hypothetical protein